MSAQNNEAQTNLPARRGGQPGNTNALRHGRFSTRFANLLRLTGPGAISTPSRGPLSRQLDLLEAVIEDLADQTNPEPQLLIFAIKTFAQIHMTNALLKAARARSPTTGHSNCATCNAIWINSGLDGQGRCPSCAQKGP